MLYHAYELTHAAISPMRTAAKTGLQMLQNPLNPLKLTLAGKASAAALEMFEANTRRYGKPDWQIHSTLIDDVETQVTPKVVMRETFVDLIHFQRDPGMTEHRDDPKVLLIAPMSGHFATLLRGTVAAMLPEHDVYISDWRDARMVPLTDGIFGFDHYVHSVISMIKHLGPNIHVIAVCQPGPAVVAAVSLMHQDNDPLVPATMTIMGGPVDPRKSPTVPNKLATERSLDWFERNMISRVPYPHPGFMRAVYPGFLQLTGFMAMNMDHHFGKHMAMFQNLVRGDGDSTEKHRQFYDEYNSVMDLDAKFYLDTIKRVFQDFELPLGTMKVFGRHVEPASITRTALLTVEGEHDDISGIGQTKAAHDICINIPSDRRLDHLQKHVGHYGVFNGRRFRTEIQPIMKTFMRTHATAL
ncbi:MAG: polyhydroxyalkanoate depolymerase [Alphaproteobacteria bacterium]